MDEAYRHCIRIARAHYENFPVLSRFLPRQMRPHVAAVYAFARAADDDADEIGGDEGISRLDAKRERIIRKQFHGDPVFEALGQTMTRFDLPPGPFLDLISAFRQDCTKNRYATFPDVLDYCSRSANPVGRVVLMLSGLRDAKRFEQSDRICTALQLINFWQDVRADHIQRDRIYIPQEDLNRFGVSEADIAQYGTPHAGAKFCELIRFESKRTAEILHEGLPLASTLPFRLRLPIALFAAGGMTILEQIRADRPRPSLDDSGRRWRMGINALRILRPGNTAKFALAAAAT